MEVQQFTKFFHLVPAQGLRKASAALPSASFEDLLAELETQGSHQVQPQAQGLRAAVPPAVPGLTLLRRPSVFTLAIVWESPQAPQDAIRGTIEALGCELEPSDLFHMPSSSTSNTSPAFQLRCVVCYFGHHYLVFVLSDQLRLWLLIDDDDIQLVGQWADVCRTMVARRLQPSLLFYEDGSAGRANFSGL